LKPRGRALKRKLATERAQSDFVTLKPVVSFWNAPPQPSVATRERYRPFLRNTSTSFLHCSPHGRRSCVLRDEPEERRDSRSPSPLFLPDLRRRVRNESTGGVCDCASDLGGVLGRCRGRKGQQKYNNCE
jgi:hypothetical protein